MRNLRLLPMVALVLLLSGCQMRVLEPASHTASKISDLIYLSFWLMMIVLVVVFLLFTYFIRKYKETEETKGSIPNDGKENKWLEATWTILPILLLTVLAVPTVKATYDLTYKSAAENGFKKDELNVQVEAKRFSWTFTYENGKKSYNELVLPVDQKTAFTLMSKDVVHSFWVPKLAGKIDAIPGRKTHLAFTPDTVGTYQGKCGEFCGTGHAYMRFETRVVSEEDFEKWLKTTKD